MSAEQGETYSPARVEVPDAPIALHAHLSNLLAKLYPMIDREEIKQELWLAYYASNYHQDGPGEDEETALRLLRKAMRRAGERMCRREKAERAGYAPHDEAFYSSRALGSLCEEWFAGGVTEAPPRTYESSVSRASTGDASRGGDWTVSLIDIDVGMRRLNPAQQKILFYAYSPEYAGKTDEDIAMELNSQGWKGMTREKFRGKVRWALNRLQRELGGQNPWH